MNDTAKMITAAVKNARRSYLKNSPQLRLGELIELLEAGDYEDDCYVNFDFCSFKPGDLMSWRGSYEELAIGYFREGDYNSVKVLGFLKKLKDAVGTTFEGYKGGNYTMTLDTPVWVSNYGEAAHTAVVGVLSAEDMAGEVIIQTAYSEYS